MKRNLTLTIWLTAAISGGMAALALTWIGDAIGAFLESVSPLNLRSWEMAALQISIVNAITGMVAGYAGALSYRWARGLVGGAFIHFAVFAAFLATSESFRAAPATVNLWMLWIGIVGGAGAGALGGLIAQFAFPAPHMFSRR